MSDRGATTYLVIAITSLAIVAFVGQVGRIGPLAGIGEVGAAARDAVAGPALHVDVRADRHPISPLVYGINFADEDLAKELRLPVRRWGGNSTSRYNWRLDAHNTGSDWFFENIASDNPRPAELPDGSATDRFVEQDRRTATASLLTIPMIGWVAKRRVTDHPFDCGFSIKKYGPQQSSDKWDADCGNGKRPDGSLVTGNDPADTSIRSDPEDVAAWMRHLTERYGLAADDGVRFYDLDNEPTLWNDTHRDVHSQPLGYDELLTRTVSYGAAVKAADPGAQLLGPVAWGWTAYWYSALDAAPGGAWWEHPRDRLAHGNTPFAPWYLAQMRAYEAEHGTRLLDYFDLHYYPQASGVALSSAGDATTQARRLRTTRSLWDPDYADESWIADAEGGPAARLIPRMKEWVDKNYPGTKLAISEYNWGALDDMNGALAQADVLGIFGREGLDLAALWSPPKAEDPGAFAFRMYRNYDGRGGEFGDVGVHAESADEGKVAVYAAVRTGDGALTVMCVNKTGSEQRSTLTADGFDAWGLAEVYRYSPVDLQHIRRLPDLVLRTAGPVQLELILAPDSITLINVPEDVTRPKPPPTATPNATPSPTPTPMPTVTPTSTARAAATNTATAPNRTATQAPTSTGTMRATATEYATDSGESTPTGAPALRYRIWLPWASTVHVRLGGLTTADGIKGRGGCQVRGMARSN